MEEEPSAGGIGEVLTAARGAVDQEFHIAERLDAKARGLVTLGAQWFAVAQAVAAVAYATHRPHDWMLWAVAGIAFAAAVALGVLFFFCWKAWYIREEETVSPAGLLEMREAALAERSPTKLVDYYAYILQERRTTNTSRTDALATAQWVWLVAMAAPLVELGFALATRLAA